MINTDVEMFWLLLEELTTLPAAARDVHMQARAQPDQGISDVRMTRMAGREGACGLKVAEEWVDGGCSVVLSVDLVRSR